MKVLSGWKYVALVLVAFGLVFWALTAVGVVPATAFGEMLTKSLVGPAAWRETLRETTPLLIAGLAVFIALKAGLFNIGAEGQFLVGSASAVAVGLAIPTPLGAILGTLAGVVAGALWALPAALIKAYRGGHEVITTIMLNSVAVFLCRWLVNGPMKNPDQQSPTTAVLQPGACLPYVIQAPPFRLNIALVLGVLLLPVVWVWLRRTVSGYELSASGSNPKAAENAGIAIKRVCLRAMVVSGGLAGLAGAFQALAYEQRFYDGFSPGYGFDALGVALLSGGSVWGIFPSALLFGVISRGTTAVQFLGVPKGMSGILLGLLIAIFAAVRYGRKSRHE